MAMTQVIWAHAKVWQSVWIIWIPRYATIVILTVLLSPRHGAMGAAYAYTAGQMAYLAGTAYLVFRIGLSVPSRSEPAAYEQLSSA
jgi:hypothetical protein